jgi:hypothetical protein
VEPDVAFEVVDAAVFVVATFLCFLTCGFCVVLVDVPLALAAGAELAGAEVPWAAKDIAAASVSPRIAEVIFVMRFVPFLFEGAVRFALPDLIDAGHN